MGSPTLATADTPAAAPPAAVEVAVIGAGFGGLGMAIQLKRAGYEDFVVLERGPDVGGTWRANTYPGCQCDIPSNLYSFSFAPKPDWTRSYPEQPQILEYLRGCARRFGIESHLRLGCELLEARWDGAWGHWRLSTSRGRCTARVLVAAPGLLSEPRIPAVPGLEGFGGASFHSARWDHGVDLAGKRVALVGTGASAIQIGPRLQPRVSRLSVFQRTPPWVLPHPDRSVGRPLRRAYAALPGLQRLVRAGIYTLHEGLVPGMIRDPRLLRLQEATATALLRRQVPDPDLRARVTPNYPIGCKRILLSNDWYPMLCRPNVELVAEPIGGVDHGAVVTEAGRHEVDAIIFATGFAATDLPIAHRVVGRDGRSLAGVWGGSPQAYLGTTVAGFPNLFLLYGPNTNLGHSSIIYMLESQFRYVLGALAAMRSRALATLEVRPGAQAAWQARVHQRLGRSVWNSGCASWYLDANGTNSTMWPGFTFEFRRRTRRFDLASYRAEAPSPVGPTPALEGA